jgi:hypothetical protein
LLIAFSVLIATTAHAQGATKLSINPAKETVVKTAEGCSVIVGLNAKDWPTQSWSGICTGSERYALGPGVLKGKLPFKGVSEFAKEGWMLYGRFVGLVMPVQSGTSKTKPMESFWWQETLYMTNVRKGERDVSFASATKISSAGTTSFMLVGQGPATLFRNVGSERAELGECSGSDCVDLWGRNTQAFYEDMETFIAKVTPEIEAAKRAAMPAYLSGKEEADQIAVKRNAQKSAQEVVVNASARQFDMAQATRESRPLKTPNLDQLIKSALRK